MLKSYTWVKISQIAYILSDIRHLTFHMDFFFVGGGYAAEWDRGGGLDIK